MNMARPGRPVEPIGGDLLEVVREWVEALRATVFQPLMFGEHPMKLRDIADRLQQMTPAPDGTGVGGQQRSGRGETSVQRMQSGRLVPTRDVVFDLLRLVEEERGAPGGPAVQILWAAYKPALRERLPDVYASYEVLDAYVGVRRLAQLQRQQLDQLQRDRDRDGKRLARVETRVRRAQQAGLVLRRALRTAGQEVRALQHSEHLLTQSVQQLSSMVADLKQEVARAKTSAQDWQEQTSWLRSLHEESEREAVLNSEAWAEREALLLERLVQAYETLEAAADEAQAVQAVLRSGQEHWQQRAAAAEAEVRLTRDEAEAVQAEVLRTLHEQQDLFSQFVARAQDQQEEAAQTIASLERQLEQTRLDVRRAEADAVRADAKLSAFLRERDLMGALDEIVSHALDEHDALDARELSRFDASPAANTSGRSEHVAVASVQPDSQDRSARFSSDRSGTDQSRTITVDPLPRDTPGRLRPSFEHETARHGPYGRPVRRIRWGRLSVVVLAAAVVLTGFGYTLWKFWPGTDRHHGAAPTSPKSSASTAGPAFWSYNIEAPVRGAPVIVGDTVYTSGGLHVYALDAATGRRKWRATIKGGANDTLTVLDGTVYLEAFKNRVYALDARNGTVKWSRTVGGTINYSSPAAAGHLVYIGSHDDFTLYALDTDTGEIRWKKKAKGAFDAQPIIDGNTLYVGADGDVFYALDATTGAVRWTQFVGGDGASERAVIQGDTVYVGSYDHRVYALNKTTGSQKWVQVLGTGDLNSTPTIDGSYLYIASGDGKTYALAIDTGKIKWSRNTDSSESSPAAADGLVYIGSRGHKIYALNGRTGAVVWTHPTSEATYPSGTLTKGTLYIGSDDETIYALNAKTGEGSSRRLGAPAASNASTSTPTNTNGGFFDGPFS
jgi:FOG: WD40-like repeat